MQSTNTHQFADAFGAISLARFAAAPASSHTFRVQHDLLSRMMDMIVFESHSYSSASKSELAERALEVANLQTTLRSLLETHHVLESEIVHKVLGADPRQRLVAEQFEREASSAMTEFDKLLVLFGSPSHILAQMSEFSNRAGAVFARIKERFKAEERDLFPTFDRLTAGTDTAVTLLSMSNEASGALSPEAAVQDDVGSLGALEAVTAPDEPQPIGVVVVASDGPLDLSSEEAIEPAAALDSAVPGVVDADLKPQPANFGELRLVGADA